MITLDENYQESKMEGYKKFILNKIANVDTDYDYENALDSNVFKISSHIQVDLNEYEVDI